MSGRRILVSNDDGYDAPGLRCIEASLAELGEVWVLAPDRERSATSNALTIREELILKQVGERRFSLNGYPADCANVAFFSGLLPKFDLVVSGINHGPNLGDDVHYSGTVAVARQAAVHDIRAVAISCAHYDPPELHLQRTAKWLATWLGENLDELRVGNIYSVNFPPETPDVTLDTPLPDVRYTYQGKRTYKDEYHVLDGEGHWLLRLKETEFGHVKQDHSDSEAVADGYVSVTPLSTFTTDRRELHKWFRKTRTKTSSN